MAKKHKNKKRPVYKAVFNEETEVTGISLIDPSKYTPESPGLYFGIPFVQITEEQSKALKNGIKT